MAKEIGRLIEEQILLSAHNIVRSRHGSILCSL